MKETKRESEIELFDAVVCAIRDREWDTLSMARSVIPDIEDFCGEFLVRMLFSASANREQDIVAVVQDRLKEYLDWILKGNCACDV